MLPRVRWAVSLHCLRSHCRALLPYCRCQSLRQKALSPPLASCCPAESRSAQQPDRVLLPSALAQDSLIARCFPADCSTPVAPQFPLEPAHRSLPGFGRQSTSPYRPGPACSTGAVSRPPSESAVWFVLPGMELPNGPCRSGRRADTASESRAPPKRSSTTCSSSSALLQLRQTIETPGTAGPPLPALLWPRLRLQPSQRHPATASIGQLHSPHRRPLACS